VDSSTLAFLLHKAIGDKAHLHVHRPGVHAQGEPENSSLILRGPSNSTFASNNIKRRDSLPRQSSTAHVQAHPEDKRKIHRR